MKPISLYFFFTHIDPNMVSDLPLLLNAWTDLKYIFLDLLCRKRLSLKNKKSMASSMFWRCLAMRGGKGIIGVVFCCSGILLIALPFMVVIWGPYMASSLLMFSVLIGKLPILFFRCF